MRILILFLCFFIISAGNYKAAGQSIRITDKAAYKVDPENYILPVWITVPDSLIQTLKINLPHIISSDGRAVNIGYKVTSPGDMEIVPSSGNLYRIVLDSVDISKLEPGKYTVAVIISGTGVQPVKESLSFEIPVPKSIITVIGENLDWVQNNFFKIIWHLFEVILLLLVMIFLVKLFVTSPVFKKRNALNVLAIVNETGKEAEYQGAALGIDDLLIYKLQEISRMSTKESLQNYWNSRPGSSKTNTQDKNVQVQRLNVVGGEFSMDLQKLGDISVGPVKIPLGSISALLLKLFGGNYVSGTLQQYGSSNKLVIRLERRPAVISFKRNENPGVQYFESSWPSETIKETDLTEGIPHVVEEMAFHLILELSKDTGTKNWLAYKYFLEGYRLYSEFEKNKTRLDLLRDSISLWRQSIKYDPDFAVAHYNLGVAYDIEGNTEDAVFRYQKAISLNPELIGAAAHFNLARLHWEKYRDEQRTTNELEKAKVLNPDIADIYNLQGLLLASGKMEYKAEAALYEKAIELSKENPNPVFYYNLSVANYYLNHYDEAQAAGEKACKLFGEKEKLTSLLQTMGVIHYQKAVNRTVPGGYGTAEDEFKKSRDYYREGLLADPHNRELLSGYSSALLKLKQLDDAERIIRRLIRLYPSDSPSYRKLGECITLSRNLTEEAQVYEEAGRLIESNPEELKNAEGSLLKKKIYFGLLAMMCAAGNDTEKALPLFAEIFQPLYDNISTSIEAELHYQYSVALFKAGCYTDSIAFMNRGIDIFNSGKRYFDLAQAYSELGKIYSGYIEILYKDYQSAERAEQNLQERSRRYVSQNLSVLLAQASENADKSFSLLNQVSREADTAFQNASHNYKISGFLKLAVKAHLDNADFLIKTFKIYGDKVYQLAREECDKAIQIDHKEFESFHVKGNTYYYMRQYAKAIPDYEKSIELNFNLPGAHYCVGLCYFFLGDYQNAAEKFRTVIKLDEKYTSPDDMNSPDAYQRLALALEKLKDINGAAAILSDAVNIHPDKVKYHILLGQVLKKRNDYDEAAAEFRAALSLDKYNLQKMRHIALAELAEIYIEYGADINSASEYINEALSISKRGDRQDPELSKIRNTIGWICCIKNQEKRALLFLEKTLASFLDDPKYHMRLAYLYEKYSGIAADTKGKEEYRMKAINQWKIVSSLNGNNRYIKLAEESLLKLAKN
jgi:tetratricopeptide (TPR) repeat protein